MRSTRCVGGWVATIGSSKCGSWLWEEENFADHQENILHVLIRLAGQVVYTLLYYVPPTFWNLRIWNRLNSLPSDWSSKQCLTLGSSSLAEIKAHCAQHVDLYVNYWLPRTTFLYAFEVSSNYIVRTQYPRPTVMCTQPCKSTWPIMALQSSNCGSGHHFQPRAMQGSTQLPVQAK